MFRGIRGPFKSYIGFRDKDYIRGPFKGYIGFRV